MQIKEQVPKDAPAPEGFRDPLADATGSKTYLTEC
jgi:hypothetical protein